MNTNLKEMSEILLFQTKSLIFIIQCLIDKIESATNFDPPSNKYQIEFLKQIDLELSRGQTEASAWRNKLILQNVGENES